MSLKGKGPVHHLNRSTKAKMIEAFFVKALGKPVENLKILDIGCGNGQIGNYFAQNNEVDGVDVEDKTGGNKPDFNYLLIEDENLPFKDDHFDLIISHHVIEHVTDQSKHLSEIRRTLKPNGLAYLGCPNKASPFMAGHVGNDSVLKPHEAENLFRQAGFIWQETYTDFLSQPDIYHCDLRIGKYIPAFFIKLFRQWYPSHCYLLRQA